MQVLRTLFLTVFLMTSFFANAAIMERDYVHADFEKAEASSDQLSFMIKSTKAGIWTSEVFGYVKSFHFKGDFENGIWKSGEITFKIRDLDTDNNSRNEKMHILCLDYEKSKIVTIKVSTPISVGSNMKVPAIMIIRKKEKHISMLLNMKKIGDKYEITGNSITSFKALEIPDPSIFIAKVDDTIKINFKLKI